MIKKGNNIFEENLGLLIILIAPFVQLGLSYYLSVSFIVFILAMVISLNTSVIMDVMTKAFQVGILVFFAKSILLVFSMADTRSALIPLRELLCYVGIFFISSQVSRSRVDEHKFFQISAVLLGLIAILIAYQTSQITTGKYFGFPIDYFVMNQETLKGADLALQSGTRFRATSFYGEPSYTSWIVISLLAINLQNTKLSIKAAFFLFFLSFFSVAVSQSISGVVAVIVIFSYWYIFSQNIDARAVGRRIVGFSFIFLILVACFFIFQDLTSRFQAIIDLSDQSSNVRFQDPLIYIEKVFTKGELFGITNYADVKIDNAGLGILIHYGILSIVILLTILKQAKSKLMILYILLSLNFNGTIFRYDKVLIIGLTIGLSRKFITEAHYVRPEKKRKLVLLS